MKLHHAAFLATMLGLPAGAGAADLGPGAPYAGVCVPPVYASVPLHDPAVGRWADHATIQVVWNEVQPKLQHAITVSQSPAVVYNPSQAYTWAEATKLSCGKAIGYLVSHEVNALQIHECDCFYRRMTALLH